MELCSRSALHVVAGSVLLLLLRLLLYTCTYYMGNGLFGHLLSTGFLKQEQSWGVFLLISAILPSFLFLLYYYYYYYLQYGFSVLIHWSKPLVLSLDGAQQDFPALFKPLTTSVLQERGLNRSNTWFNEALKQLGTLLNMLPLQAAGTMVKNHRSKPFHATPH